MNYNNRKFWDEALDEIDEKLASRAAERLTGSGGIKTNDDIPDINGPAVEVKTSGRRSRAPLFAGIGAAAAAAVAIGIGLNLRSDKPPVADSGETAEAVQTEETAEIIDTSLFTWQDDPELYREYFYGRWQAVDYSYEKGVYPELQLSFATDLGDIMHDDNAGLYKDENGCYLHISGADTNLYYVADNDRDTLISHTAGETTETVYKRSGDVDDSCPSSNGLGMKWFTDNLGMPSDIFDRLSFTDRSGTEWKRDSYTDGLNMRVYDQSNISMPFCHEVRSESGLLTDICTRYFYVTIDDNGGISAVAESSFTEENSGKTFDLSQIIGDDFDYSVYKLYFSGLWESDNDPYFSKLKLAYNTNEMGGSLFPSWNSFFCCTETREGFWLMGMSGGCGQLLFIPADDPDTMYYYMDVGEVIMLDSPDAVYRRSGFCDYDDFQLIGELNTIGNWLFNEKMEAVPEESFLPAYRRALHNFTDENGVEWTTKDVPGGITTEGVLGYNCILEFTDDRFVFVKQFMRTDSWDDYFAQGEFRPFVLTVEKTDGVWNNTTREYDIRFDWNPLDLPPDSSEQDYYYHPFIYGWERVDRTELDVNGMNFEYGKYSFTDMYGRTWVSSTNVSAADFRLYDWIDGICTAALPFTWDTGEKAVTAQFVCDFAVDFDDPNGWELQKVWEYDYGAYDYMLTMPAMHTGFDYHVYTERFAGRWLCEDLTSELTLDCVTPDELGIEDFTHCWRGGYSGSYEWGWYLYATKDNTAYTLFIPAADPESLYLYIAKDGEDWPVYKKPDRIYRRTEYFPDSRLDITLDGEKNQFAKDAAENMKYSLSEENYDELMNVVETPYYENGVEWRAITDYDELTALPEPFNSGLVTVSAENVSYKYTFAYPFTNGKEMKPLVITMDIEFRYGAVPYDMMVSNFRLAEPDELTPPPAAVPLSQSEADALFAGEWQNPNFGWESFEITEGVDPALTYRTEAGAYYRASETVLYFIPDSLDGRMLRYTVTDRISSLRLCDYYGVFVRQ